MNLYFTYVKLTMNWSTNIFFWNLNVILQTHWDSCHVPSFRNQSEKKAHKPHIEREVSKIMGINFTVQTYI